MLLCFFPDEGAVPSASRKVNEYYKKQTDKNLVSEQNLVLKALGK